MQEQFERTAVLIGDKNVDILSDKYVAVFGVGGVGGYVVEALARSGVGNFELIDNDKVSKSNINRQIIATLDTVGKLKTEVMKERIVSINSEANVRVKNCFYLPETADEFDFTKYDYVVDAVDTVTAKLDIIVRAKNAGVPVISCMGAGNKLDATAFEVSDIYKTSVCPLAKVMRKELKKRNIDSLKVVYSKEIPKKGLVCEQCENGKRSIPGSIAYVPSVAGLIIAGEVIKDLISYEESKDGDN